MLRKGTVYRNRKQAGSLRSLLPTSIFAAEQDIELGSLYLALARYDLWEQVLTQWEYCLQIPGDINTHI